MPKKNVYLELEQLEDRVNPSSLVPWADPQHLTLSFAPDGTEIQGEASKLFVSMNSQATQSAWQKEILRATQTWAAQANLNISVVADGGQPFGTTGAIQGDSRFGDIRIGAKPLPLGTAATGTFFDWTGTTWAGDIILNSNYQFGLGGKGDYDLFSVVLHEVGHALGISDESASPSSVMYPSYSGTRTGLSSEDIADIRALYSARAPDANDTPRSNNSLSSATSMGGLLVNPSRDGDITTTKDADFYQFTTPLTVGLKGFVVQVQTARFSALLPMITVYNSAGKVLGSKTALDSTTGNLTLQINNVSPLTKYYVRISGASTDAFGIGSYRVGVHYLYSNSLIGAVGSVLGSPWNVVNDLHLNDTLQTATQLLPIAGSQNDARFQYFYTAKISDSSDVDYYQIRSVGSEPRTMAAMVWAVDAQPLHPRISVFDGNKNPMPVQVIANNNGTYTVQITNVAPGKVFYLKVSALNPADSNNTGAYVLGVNFHKGPPLTLDNLHSNTLTRSSFYDAGFLKLGQSELINLSLTASNGGSASVASVTMTIKDEAGKVIATLTAAAGQPPVTAVLYLKAGTYKIEYLATFTETAPAFLHYWLDCAVLSDPVGAYPTAPPFQSQPPPQPPPQQPPPAYVSSTPTSTYPPPAKPYTY